MGGGEQTGGGGGEEEVDDSRGSGAGGRGEIPRMVVVWNVGEGKRKLRRKVRSKSRTKIGGKRRRNFKEK